MIRDRVLRGNWVRGVLLLCLRAHSTRLFVLVFLHWVIERESRYKTNSPCDPPRQPGARVPSPPPARTFYRIIGRRRRQKTVNAMTASRRKKTMKTTRGGGCCFAVVIVVCGHCLLSIQSEWLKQSINLIGRRGNRAHRLFEPTAMICYNETT